MLQQENNNAQNTEQKNQNKSMSRKKRAPKRIFYADAKYGSLVLAKFIMDYSFEGIFSNQLSNEEKLSYYKISNESFSNIFTELSNAEASYTS